jgi:hypothetical protein
MLYFHGVSLTKVGVYFCVIIIIIIISIINHSCSIMATTGRSLTDIVTCQVPILQSKTQFNLSQLLHTTTKQKMIHDILGTNSKR